MKRGFKTRIYLSEWQEKILFNYCKVYHNMWNFLVEKYKNQLPSVNSYGIKGYKPFELLSDFGNPDVPQRLVLGVQKQFGNTVENFFNKKSFRPKFHKFNPKKQSFYLASLKYDIYDDGYIPFPIWYKGKCAKSQRIKIDMGVIRKYNITEVKEPRFLYIDGKWFLTGVYDFYPNNENIKKEFLGLDWGIKNFMTTSNGEFINYPDSVIREYQRIKRLQSIRDKKKKNSKNYIKATYRIHKAYKRFESLKKDFIEKKTKELAVSYNIAVEKLDEYFNDSKKYVRREIFIHPRERFNDKLKWKCELYNSHFIKIDPFLTSKTCSVCGLVHNDLTLADRMLICECGNNIDRDVNAAINIKNAAIAASVFVAR